MKLFNTLVLVLIGSGISLAQEQINNRTESPWSFQVKAGIQSMNTSGIPKSRNQINFESSKAAENAPTYDQQSGIAGLVMEAGVMYSIKPEMRVGLMVNSFRDDDEYLNQSDLVMNVAQIAADSLQKMSIRNMQSYLNVGLDYAYDFMLPFGNRHKITLGLAAGVTFNRTPDRTEYDVFEDNNYVRMPVAGSTEDWYVTHTRFHSGWFVMPSITYGLKVGKKNWLNFSLATSQHGLATTGEVKILDKVSSGSQDKVPYTLRAMQIKLGYSF